MKKLILCLMILLLSSLCFAGETDAERLEAAKRYAKVSNFDQMMSDMIRNMARSMPPEEAKVFVEFMGSCMEGGALEKSTVILMAKHFSTDELNALADFYGTEMGQRILKKFGPYMAESQGVIQQFMLKAIEDYKRKREHGESLS